MRTRLIPKLFSVFKEGYSSQLFFKDLLAGVIVAIIALPLSIALAIASGARPEQGLYTAIIGGFLIAFFGGSRVQIGGPTGAFIVIIYGIITKYGYDGLAVATLLSGAMLICMGVIRLGNVIKFIPYPVTIGFTSGIALIIFTSQIKDLFGLQVAGNLPSEFWPKCVTLFQHFQTLDFSSAFIGIMSLVILIFFPKITKKIPASLVAVFLAPLVVHFAHLDIASITSRFGEIPTHLPMPHFPHVTWELCKQLFQPALSIALLAGIESLLSAVIADGMTGGKHRSNMELVAQGLANIGSIFFQGLPATGAIARTATNIKNGGKTPIAGIVHSVTLLVIMMCFGKWAGLIPMPVLAAILMLVAYHMSEWRLFVSILKAPKSDVLVLLSTFFLTVFVDIIVAIQVGVVLAALLFMKHMSENTKATHLTDDANINEKENFKQLHNIPQEIEVFEVYGPMFFGAVYQFKETLDRIQKKPKVLILRMRHIMTLDASALKALEDVTHKAKIDQTTFFLSGIHGRVLHTLRKSGIAQKIGEKNIFDHFEDALSAAKDLVTKK
ncbi:MAG: sodium-independent anion transporter [Deltaproteobacteria bacterium CG_4_10_14_0_2_um_filter_43_8]|nr:MAG: sodium-independent anion transporter [Deltaproteobacteria bacterium CG11_big_fil_rev_8_21_14_0_20_42_23]PJA19060.1 MAG: sodium-independent anion transporter [Deltaproteobacteria bacterium CG_4_10_14_0_2_um_filter_43_8]PJC64167.1 MAG: sodium-independent anion transporter [Deltaproteobacteria bacterium CG_4_9_14_0_2_um_filter_42_21]